MKRLEKSTWGIILGLFCLIVSCEKSALDGDQPSEVEILENSENFFQGPVPDATVQIKEYSTVVQSESKSMEGAVVSESSLTASINETLYPEESHTQTLTGTVSGGPSVGDMMFVMDLTGSMGDELSNAKANSVNIMNAIRTLIPNTNFGLVSHMDYTAYYSSCGYSNTYGNASYDYPYRLDKSLTSDVTEVQSGLASLSLGYGSDGPESYNRALWELANDSGIGWRIGSKRVAIVWLDAIPHDCDVHGLIGQTGSTGIDPGRDETVGTSDDLIFDQTLSQLKAKNISLITLYSGDYYPLGYSLWSAASQFTGGKAYQINTDGTIPGGTDISTYIAGLIAEDLNNIDKLTIEVCDPAYETWFTNLDPVAYYDLVLDSPISKDYDVTITVPAGTPTGVYNFELCLVGDGAVYAKTDVTINVPDGESVVAIDVHPESCPNPIGIKNRGFTPVSISGTADFDVEDIDVSSITLEGVSPKHHSYEDVSTPYEIDVEEGLDLYDCHTLGADGFMDLSLKFDNQELLSAIGSVEPGEVLQITMEGKLKDGTDISGSEIIVIR